MRRHDDDKAEADRPRASSPLALCRRSDAAIVRRSPSRHALEFLDYPARLGLMLETRTLEWVASLARLAGASLEDRPEDRGLIAWGKRRVGHLVSNLVGAMAIRDIAALFGEFVGVRERWLALVHRVQQRIVAPSTRYMLVTSTSGSSLDDAEYLLGELEARKLGAAAVLLNRAVTRTPDWLQALGERRAEAPGLAAAIGAYSDEFEARARQTKEALERLGAMRPHKLPLVPLPTVKTSDPREILEALARELDRAHEL